MSSTTQGLIAAGALTRRELVRFTRLPTRIIAAVGMAALFWLFAGSGFSGSFAEPGAGERDSVGYAAYVLPGMVTMVVMFSAMFAAISLIQDRQAGFLQSALVSPAPRWSITIGKVLGGALIATAQGSLLLVAAPLVGLQPTPAGYTMAIAAAALASAGVIGLGLALAWRINSVPGFHGVMNLVLLPMWALSGSLFPARGASPWLASVMRINPLHWATRCIGGALGISGQASALHWLGTAGFATVMVLIAYAVMSGRSVHLGSEVE